MKDLTPSAGDLIEVFWDDIQITSDWEESDHIEDYDKETECKAAGYFLRENDKFVILAGIAAVHSSHVNAVTHIPVGCITTARKL